MKKKWLATLHSDSLYKTRQLQAISYASLLLNIVLVLLLLWIIERR